ncbi:ABC transporter I family member 21-like isoform X2 [Phragmites australis]|uniref:ABC transporter I family member 21-like isoform X2 n=1 Tax=Phragmites australis TaxID=29695 RepID=UPI002D78FD9A|nr:ABC transporter I family member 21-like isoform X2 [Phragmites australis]
MDQGDVPLQGDFSAEHTIFGVDGVDPVRREKLVDLQWHMHKVSDGQRRRVQICMGLLHPYKDRRTIIEELLFQGNTRAKVFC